jgi:hypothetical protein
VHVGAADAHRIDSQHNLPRHQVGLWTIEQLNFQRLGVDKGFHGLISVGGSGRISD